VSYTLFVDPRARAAFATLEIWLQEETLDEIERLLADPNALRLRRGEDIAVHDFKRARSGTEHYVFLTIRTDRAASRLEILTLGHVAKQG
jgi:hypothetical protein